MSLASSFIEDSAVSIIPVFQIKEGHTMADCQPFLSECARLVKEKEPNCFTYSVVVKDDQTFSLREAYKSADDLLYHMEVVTPTLMKLAEHADVVDMDIHGAEEQLDKLMHRLGHFKPKLWKLQSGGVRNTKSY